MPPPASVSPSAISPERQCGTGVEGSVTWMLRVPGEKSGLGSV